MRKYQIMETQSRHIWCRGREKTNISPSIGRASNNQFILISKLKRNLVIIAATTIVLSFFINIEPSQQQGVCPKVCTCNDQKLEVLCKEPIGTSGIPHTLHPATKRLVLNHAQITIPVLSSYSDLETVDMAFNKLTNIDFQLMQANERLTSLNTSHNNIFEVKDSAVNGVIADFGATTINPSESHDPLKDHLKELKKHKINFIELIMSHNNLPTLRNYTFLRLHRLQRLDLSYNLIAYLEDQSLFGLNKLEQINLRGNRLTQLPTQALAGTTRLPFYSNSQSEIVVSPLRSIDLSENAIVSIEPGSFSTLERTQELYLESCAIQAISSHAFRGLGNLYSLSLEKNELIEVPTESFRDLISLKLLKLNGNSIAELPHEGFSHLFSLEELQINNGSLGRMHAGAFRGLSSLNRLEIAHNPNLTNIERGVFDNLLKLTHLSLFSNNLTSLPDSFEGTALKILDLRNNPFECGCDLKWLTKRLKGLNETFIQKLGPNHDENRILIRDTSISMSELIDLTCAGPPALAGKLIAQLPDNGLECLSPSSDLNVQVGFVLLTLMILTLTAVCTFNFCRNEKHLIGILKENLMALPYTRNLHRNVDTIKKEETHLECAGYEPVYTVPGDQYYHSEPQQQTHQM